MNEPITFTFSKEERALAKKEGVRRQTVNEGRNLRGRNGGAEAGKDALKIHIIGAGGEMAVASYLGLKDHLYQESEAKRGSVDLPPNIDVKTAMKHSFNLIVQLDDAPDKKYVLVTIEKKTCLIHGWIDSKDAMLEKYKADFFGGRPAYFIPKSALNPISTLL